MKAIKIVYYVTTALFSVMMLMSAGNMLLNTEAVAQNFRDFGYPDYIPIPLGIAKLLGVGAIWANLSKSLKEWAYAGFFFNAVLALTAHISINDGNWPGAAVFIVLLLTSYFCWRRMLADDNS